MWTKKAASIVSMSIIATLLGLATRNLLLVMIAIAGLVYTTVSVFANTSTRLTADREMSQEKIFEDGTVKVELRILNQGGKTGFLEVRDKLPRTIQLKEGTNYTYLNLNPKGATRLLLFPGFRFWQKAEIGT